MESVFSKRLALNYIRQVNFTHVKFALLCARENSKATHPVTGNSNASLKRGLSILPSFAVPIVSRRANN